MPQGDAVFFGLAPFREQGLEIERFGHHRQLIPIPRPGGPRPVAVDLDANPVRVAQIKRLGNTVVSSAGKPSPRSDEAPQRNRQRGARRQKQREVVKPGRTRTLPSGRVLHQMKKHGIARTQPGLGAFLVEHSQAHVFRVERSRAGQIRHGERNRTQAGCRSEFWRHARRLSQPRRQGLFSASKGVLRNMDDPIHQPRAPWGDGLSTGLPR